MARYLMTENESHREFTIKNLCWFRFDRKEKRLHFCDSTGTYIIDSVRSTPRIIVLYEVQGEQGYILKRNNYRYKPELRAYRVHHLCFEALAIWLTTQQTEVVTINAEDEYVFN